MGNFSHMQKGNAKRNKAEKVFEIKPAIREGMVKYELGGSKNTVIYGKAGQSIEELKLKYGIEC